MITNFSLQTQKPMKRTSLFLSIGVIALLGIFLIIYSCKKDEGNNNSPSPNTAPVAAFTVSPASGTTQTNFLFDASSSCDNEDATSVLQVRWDWENDGEWDTDWSADKDVNHTFFQEGTYSVSLEVKDTQGLSDASSQNVQVSGAGGGTGQPCPGIPTYTYQGQTYNTVLIGSQCWMKENLNYAIGDSWCYDDDPANCNTYGRLYDWATIMNGDASSNSVPSGVQGICPDGWHVPSDEEWKILEGTVDTQYGVGSSEWDDDEWRGKDVGKRLKTVAGWAQNTGTDAYGFSALPGGYRHYGGNFNYVEGSARFWSSTEDVNNDAWNRNLIYINDEAGRSYSSKTYGFSLRCVKD